MRKITPYQAQPPPRNYSSQA